MLAAWVSLPIAAFFLMVLIILVPSLAIRDRRALLAVAGLALVPAIWAISGFATIPVLKLFESFLYPSGFRLFALFVSTLPFAFIFVALSTGLEARGARTSRLHVVVPAVIAAVSIAATVGLALAHASDESSYAITIAERRYVDDGRTTIVVRGERMEAIDLSRDGARVSLVPDVVQTLPSSGRAPSNLVVVSEARALTRRVVSVAIDFPSPPSVVALSLLGSDGGMFYDANYPWSQSLDGKSVEISIGANPPQRLIVELVLESGYSGELSIEARYADTPSEYVCVDERYHIVASSLTVVDKVWIEASR
jgi:hypothetical protein